MGYSVPVSQVMKTLRCQYKNESESLQVVRLQEPSKLLERVLYPQEIFLFEAFSQSVLEVFSGNLPQSLLEGRILCQTLHINA